jgi:hypothetical protein
MDISKGALGLVAAVGIVAGAAGAFVATHVGTPAQGAQPAVEAPDTLTQPPVVVPAETVATPAAPVPATVTRAAADRRPVAAAPSRSQAPSRTARSASTPSGGDSARAETPAPQIAPSAPLAPAAEPLAERQPDVVTAVEQPKFEDLVLPAQSVIGIQVERTVSSETAQVEDEVIARVTRDVRVGDRVVIPAGSKATGFVTLVDRGGRLKDRAKLGLRFTSVTLADGTRVPIVTEAIYREGDSPRNESAAKIGGGAIGGAILGGILGGAKGAAIGGSIGAGAGSAAVYAGGRNAATLPAGSPITVRLENPATVTVER